MKKALATSHVLSELTGDTPHVLCLKTRDASYGQNHWACGYVPGQFQKEGMVYKCSCGLVDECLAITCRLT